MKRLISAALALALASCAGNRPSARDTIASDIEEMRAAAAQSIKDPGRAKRVDRSIDGLGKDLLALQEAIANLRFHLRTVNARPDATRAEFDALLDTFEAERKALRSRILARHFELTAATTEEEWKALWRHERDALSVAAH